MKEPYEKGVAIHSASATADMLTADLYLLTGWSKGDAESKAFVNLMQSIPTRPKKSS
jgi:hypothetical protein